MSNGNASFREPYRLPEVEPPARVPPTLLVGGGAIEDMSFTDMPPVLFPKFAFPPAHVVLQNLYENTASVGSSIKRCIAPFLTAAGATLRDTFRRVYGTARRVGWWLRELARDMGLERVQATRVTFDGR